MKFIFEEDNKAISKEELRLLVQEELQKNTTHITVIITLSDEEAKVIATQIPDSVIIDKVRNHIRKSGNSGLVNDIKNQLI